MNIVLTGSLGHISKPLATELIAKGHSVTVISSKAERQKEIEALGAKAAIGKMEDAEFLTNTFTGADIVYCMATGDRSRMFHKSNPLTLQEMEDNMNLIWNNYKQAIQKTNVRKVILLSTIGAHTDKGVGVLKWGYYAEKTLNELPADVSIKVMRPVGFYYNLLGFAAMIKQLSKGVLGALMSLRYYGLGGFLSGKRGVILNNLDGSDVNVLVSTFDIASVIAEEIETPFVGRTIRYIASEELTCNEVAKILGEAIGKPYLKWGRISDKQLLNAMKGMGMSEGVAKGFVEFQAAGRGKNGLLGEDYYKHRPELSKTKLKSYMPEFVEAYNKN
ncbi:NAD(P)H-binding protein [Chitinophaga sp.]|uniref:SDR family oxidoreductase n=1 Tax=Chitinophaga sp. TaxID=1869181 RepID=UPI0031D23415